MEEHGDDAASVSFHYVLLPLDGSAFALAALPTARALSERFGADLMTISVAADEGEAGRLHQHAVESLADRDGNADRAHVVIGADPAPTVTARAAELGSCLVCMSTRGRGRVAGTVIGSVARAVLQSSRAPIVAVGPQADRPGALVGRARRRPARWPEPLSVRRLVACVDGSSASEAVLPVAARWARALDMRLAIVTVAEDVVATHGAGPAPNRFGPPHPTSYVGQLADRWKDLVPDTAGEVVFDPIGVVSGLRAHLAAQPAGLVALTTHARAGLDRLRLGAVAADIVRTSTAPALVVPSAAP
ncbi:MAG: universal stress protein [Actinomycetota bacterium]|nr:universal stress protein [Actinomycetota bacterium]